MNLNTERDRLKNKLMFKNSESHSQLVDLAFVFFKKSDKNWFQIIAEFI